jgi:hypothetical protein
MSWWKFSVLTHAVVTGITYIRIVATFLWLNITVLNIMTLIVTGKLQDFTIFNKTKKFVRILFGGRHKEFVPTPRIAFFTQK